MIGINNMDIEKLKQILIDNKIFISEKSKNFVCKCCYCNDHPNPSKWGHLYVSKDESIPVCHCWMCGTAVPIPKLISDLTGNKNLYKNIISDEQLQNSYQKTKQYSAKQRTRIYKIPEISNERFSEKKLYIRKRTGNKLTSEEVPNLILNFFDFLNINKLDIVGQGKLMSDWEADLIHRNFVCFLSSNHSMLFCRNIDPNATFKFKKIYLQEDPLYLLDYWKIPVREYGNTIILSEGNFDILCEYAYDSLELKNDVRLYASGNSFSYSSLLKSVCYDESIYKSDVVILSDTDKPAHWYNKFLKENEHLIRTCKIYMNRNGKDFGSYPPVPTRIF